LAGLFSLSNLAFVALKSPGKQQKPEWIGPFAFLVFWKRRPNFDLLQREKKQVDPFFGRLQSALKCSGAAGWVR
jgi:hypothetical protein